MNLPISLRDFNLIPIVAQMAEGMKDSYRNGILEKAAAARLEGGEA